ncbi:hypothetical protein BH09ACT4_BH09ACT4_17100 [soil metagenome]
MSVPYRPSWLSALTAAVDRLPGPSWAAYLVAALFFVVVGSGLGWIDGSQPVGAVSPFRVLNDAYVIYPIAVIHYLNVSAGRAMDRFRPSLGDLDAQFNSYRYRLTTPPRSVVWVATAVGAAYGVTSYLSDPTLFGVTGSTAWYTNVWLAGFTGVSTILFIIYVAVVLRQLIIVVQIHRASTAVSLYDTESHNAFSRLTLRGSILLSAPIYLFAFVGFVSGRAWDSISIPDLISIVLMMTAAILLFFLPLLGIRHRLIEQKAQLTNEVHGHLRSAIASLNGDVEAGVLDRMDGLGKQLNNLTLERDIVSKLPTWPWSTATLRGLLTSIALPILVWVVTNLLGRFVF